MMNHTFILLKHDDKILNLMLLSFITACTIVQAVVKANSQSNGKGQILTPWGSETHNGFR